MEVQLNQQKELLREMMKRDLEVVQRSRVPGQLMTNVDSTWLEKIKVAQSEDLKL